MLPEAKYTETKIISKTNIKFLYHRDGSLKYDEHLKQHYETITELGAQGGLSCLHHHRGGGGWLV